MRSAVEVNRPPSNGAPSVAELLFASGYKVFTPSLVLRSVDTLHGKVGINLDERHWPAILRSGRALEEAEAALIRQYQDSGYLLRNTQHLEDAGYHPVNAEILYRETAASLGYTHHPAWCVGTRYEQLASLSLEQLTALAPQHAALPQATVAVLKGATGQTVTVTLAGRVILAIGVPSA